MKRHFPDYASAYTYLRDNGFSRGGDYGSTARTWARETAPGAFQHAVLLPVGPSGPGPAYVADYGPAVNLEGERLAMPCAPAYGGEPHEYEPGCGY